jgi:hypothetical protein
MLRAKLPNAQYIFSFFLPECQNVFLHLETTHTEKNGCSTTFFVKTEACDLVVGMTSNLLASYDHG